MNILFLTCWYPTPSRPALGLFIKEHAKAIASVRVNVKVVALVLDRGSTISTRNVEVLNDESGIETHLIWIRSRYYKILVQNAWWQHRILKNYLRKKVLPQFNPDVIHAHIIFPCGVIGYWLAEELKRPLIISEQWSKIEKFFGKNIFSSQGRKALTYASSITAVSDFLKKKIARYVNDSSKIFIVPNVVDDSIYSFQPKSKSSALRFAAAATWAPPKLPLLMIESLNEFASKTQRKIVLKIAGKGPLFEEMKQMKTQSPFEIDFLGFQTRSEVAALLQESDYLIIPSGSETFSAIVIEAFSTGTPVIASNVLNLSALVDDANGVLCDNNPEGWVNGLSELVEKKFDRERISREAGEKYSPNAVGRIFSELYAQVVTH